MKKTITILTICIMLLAFSIVFTSCDECEHTYSADCDATCNECGEARETTTEHNYYGDCDSGCHSCDEKREVTTQHSWKPATCTTPEACEGCGACKGEALGHEWTTPDVDLCQVQSTCSRCGATEGENIEHTPNADDGNCLTEITCSVCGTVTTEAKEAHTPNADDGNCLTEIACSVCGTVTTEAKEAHTPNADDGNCLTEIACSVCGTVTTEAKEAHTPNADDGNCLTEITCSVCGTVTTEAKEAHTPNADDGDCTTSVTCEYCDHIFVEAKSHNFATAEGWNATDKEHWYSCLNEGCEAKNDYGEHVPSEDDGDCTTNVRCNECGWVLVKGNDSHTPNADDGDCTTAITCSICTTVTTEAQEEHTPNEDDGNCLTEITCSVCGTVTTEAKEAHTLTVYITNSDGTHTPACQYCHHMEPVKEPHTGEDDGDCTTFVVCDKCGLITTEAKEAHTPNADDGSCLTEITCSVCTTVTTEAKENHTTRYTDNEDDTHSLLCQYCDYVEVENEAHTFDSTTGECVCGLKRIYITDYSVTGDFPSGWSNEISLGDTTEAIGLPDVGKTAWEESDLIVIDFASNSGLKEMQGLKYYEKAWTITSYMPLYYFSNEAPTIRAIYSPYYKIDGFGFVSVGLLDGSNSSVKGTCEYIEIDCWLNSDGKIITADFSTATRYYSRLRIVAIPGQELTITTTGFTPAGSSTEVTGAYTITADAKGNAYLYGIFAEGATVTVKDDTNEILAEYTFTEKTEAGTSYALKAVAPIEITFTEAGFEQGSYTSEELAAPTTASFEFQCLNSEQVGGTLPASYDYQIKITAMYIGSSGEEEVLATTDWVDENNPTYTKVGGEEEATSLAITQEMLTKAGAQSYWFVFEYFTENDDSYTQIVHISGSISN